LSDNPTNAPAWPNPSLGADGSHKRVDKPPFLAMLAPPVQSDVTVATESGTGTFIVGSHLGHKLLHLSLVATFDLLLHKTPVFHKND